MKSDISTASTLSYFVPSTFGIYTGTGSGIGETLANVLSRLASSNSGETIEEFVGGSEEQTASDILHGLKTSTGLSWNKIAELFTVSRRAIYDWLEDKGMSDRNYSKLLSVSKAVESLEFTKPFQVRTFLIFPNSSGISAFDLLKEERYDEFYRLDHSTTFEDVKKREFPHIDLADRLSAKQDKAHTDLPGKKRTKVSRKRHSD